MASLVDFYKQKLAPKLSGFVNSIDRDKSMAGVQLAQGGLINQLASRGIIGVGANPSLAPVQVRPAQQFVSGALKPVADAVGTFGKLSFDAIVKQPARNRQLQLDTQKAIDASNRALQTAKATREAGRPDLAAQMTRSMIPQLQSESQRFTDIGNEAQAKQKALVGSGVRTGLYASALAAPVASLGAGALSTGLGAAFAGQTSPEQLGTSFGEGVKYGGMPNPVVKGGLLAKSAVGGLVNLAEDALYAKTVENRNLTPKEIALSLALPAAFETMGSLKKAIKAKQKVDVTTTPEGLTYNKKGQLFDPISGQFAKSTEEARIAVQHIKDFIAAGGKPVRTQTRLIETAPNKWVDEQDLQTFASDIDTPKLSVEPVGGAKPTEPKLVTPVRRPLKEVYKEKFTTGEQSRGFTTSVQEAPNIVTPVKQGVDSTYTPKPNDQLMGEAKTLLSELPPDTKIDFKGVKDIDQKVAATIQEAINLQNTGDYKAAANLYNNLSEQGTELGRGVQAFSLLQKMTPEAISYSVAGRIKKFNAKGGKQIPELSGDQTKLIADQVKVIDSLTGREKNIAINELEKTLNSFIPSSMLDKIATVWKAGLLTSLRTHERNLIGNTVHGGMEIAKDYLASPVDALLATKTGKRTLTATTQGIGSGFNRETGQQMVDMVKLGYDPSEQINKFDYKQITWANTPVQQFFKKYTDAVFRTLGASDKPFYNSALAHSLWNQAGAEAINAGQKGNRAFIENLVKNPTEDMMKIAIGDANVATFKDKNAISGFTNAIKNYLGKNEWAKFGGEIVMPFTGVPSSVFSQIKNYSPIGLVQGIIKAGKVLAGQVPELQRQAAQEIGRGVIGTGIYGLGAYLMSKGLMTGQPKDAAEQRQWDLENKPRNSVMVNGKWRSLNSLGPETFILLAGGKLQEEMSREDGSIANYAGVLGKDVLDQSFVQGIQAPVNAITDPSRYAKSYVGNTISSVVPNAVKDSSKAFDSKQRETNSIMDYTKLGIPGLRNTLVEKRDPLGNVMKQEPSGIGAFVDVFNSKTPTNSVIINEFSRLNSTGNNVAPGKIGKSQTIKGQKTDLTPSQLNEFEKQVGEKAQPLLTKLISSSGYQSLSDEDKASAIDNIMTSVRKQVRNTPGIKTVTPVSTTTNTGSVFYDSEGKAVDVSRVTSMPSSTNYETVKKETEKWKVADDILKLDPTDQVEAFKQLGITKEDASYYTVAKDTTEAKAAYIKDQVQGVKDFNEFAQKIAPLRKEINGEKILSDGVIDWMYNNEIITSSQKKQLKSIEYDNIKKVAKVSAKKGIVKKVKKITLGKFNLAGKVKRVKRIRTKTYKLKI